MEAFHVTKNLKFAAVMATCGAQPLDCDRIKSDGKDELVFTLAEQANGITCGTAAKLWSNRGDRPLEDIVDEIISRRGITPEEYALIQLEAGRATLGNRGVFLKCGMSRKAMISKTLKSGRQVNFREGTTKDELRNLLK